MDQTSFQQKYNEIIGLVLQATQCDQKLDTKQAYATYVSCMVEISKMLFVALQQPPSPVVAKRYQELFLIAKNCVERAGKLYPEASAQLSSPLPVKATDLEEHFTQFQTTKQTETKRNSLNLSSSTLNPSSPTSGSFIDPFQQKSAASAVRTAFRKSQTGIEKYATFVLKNFDYDKMEDKMLALKDKKWFKDHAHLSGLELENEFVDYLRQIGTAEPKHSLYKLLTLFYEDFKKTYKVKEGQVWTNIMDAVQEVKVFVEQCTEALHAVWTPFGLHVSFHSVAKALRYVTAEKVYDILIPIYRLQAENKKYEQKIDQIKYSSIADLNARTDLQLEGVAIPYQLPIQTLNALNAMNNLDDMVATFTQATLDIYTSIQEYWGDKEVVVSDAEFTPVFLYVLLKANVIQISSIINFVDDFYDHSSSDPMTLFGMTMFKSSLEYSSQIDLKEKLYEKYLFKSSDVTTTTATVATTIPLTPTTPISPTWETSEHPSDEVMALASQLKAQEEYIQSLLQDIKEKEELIDGYEKYLNTTLLQREEPVQSSRVVEEAQSQQQVETLQQPQRSEIQLDLPVTVKYLPFIVAMDEVVQISLKDHNLLSIQIEGSVAIQPTSNYDELVKGTTNTTFGLLVNNTVNLLNYAANQKYAKIVDKNLDFFTLECTIPSGVFGKGSTIVNLPLLKYRVQSKNITENPIDIQIIPQLLQGGNQLELQLEAIANSNFFDSQHCVNQLQMNLKPVISGVKVDLEEKESALVTKNLKFNGETQSLSWNVRNLGNAIKTSVLFNGKGVTKEKMLGTVEMNATCASMSNSTSNITVESSDGFSFEKRYRSKIQATMQFSKSAFK